MLRLLDANVFITAKNTYYGLDLVPAFWSWLEAQARVGTLASTDLVYNELKDGGDDLADWVREREDLIFHVKSDPPPVAAHVNSIATWARSQTSPLSESWRISSTFWSPCQPDSDRR